MSSLYPDLGSTSFPNSVDTFVTMLNMVATDGALVTQYQAAMNNGDLTTAQTILASIPSANQKIVTADKLNKFKDAILAVERFYLTDIVPYVNTKQTEWENTINLFSYIGVYSPSVQYQKNNLVEYTVSGINLLYICTNTPTIGTVPTNTLYWRPLSVQGVKGDAGVGYSFVFAWSGSTSYVLQNMVSYNNALWGCIVANTNQAPFVGSAYWTYVASIEGQIYPVQASEPVGLSTGSLWFRTL